MEVKEQVGSVRDKEAALSVDATLVEGLKLLEHGGDMDNNTYETSASKQRDTKTGRGCMSGR